MKVDGNQGRPGREIERLLTQGPWLRRLAASLISDAGLADDAVQEVYAIALERPPRNAQDERSLRAWMRRVLRSVVSLRSRRERQRSAREQGAHPPRGPEDPAYLVERSELAQRLVERVLALPEQDRAILLLKHFEGLSTTEIARTTESTPDAVRQKLARAIRRLRQRMDAESGADGRAWLAFVLPLTRRSAPTPLLVSLGGIVMWKAAVAFGVLGLALMGWKLGGGSAPVVPEGIAGPESGRVLLGENDAGTFAPEAIAFEGLGPTERVSTARSPREVSVVNPELYAPIVHGYILAREDGTPIQGAEVLVEWERAKRMVSARTRTDSDGAYSVQLPGRQRLSGLGWLSLRLHVTADAAGYGHNRLTRNWSEAEPEDLLMTFQLHSSADLDATVIDGTGKPVSDALVYLFNGARAGLSRTTDDRGRVSFPLDALQRDARLFAFEVSTGVASSGVLGPTPGMGDWGGHVLTLQPSGILEGILLNADGSPSAGVGVYSYPLGNRGVETPTLDGNWYRGWPKIETLAEMALPLALPWSWAQCDREGRFTFRALQAGQYLLAPADGSVDAGGPFFTDSTSIVLQRSGQTLVRVVVKDADSRPVPGATTCWLDETAANSIGGTTDQEGQLELLLENGDWLLRVFAVGVPPVTTTIRVPEDTAEDTLVMLDTGAARGSIVLEPRYENGDLAIAYDLLVSCVFDDGLLALHAYGWPGPDYLSIGPDGMRTLELAKGRYELTLRPQANDAADWFPMDLEVTIVPGEELHLSPTVRAGGHILFDWEGEAPGIESVEFQLVSLQTGEITNLTRHYSTPLPLRESYSCTGGKIKPNTEVEQRSRLLEPGGYHLVLDHPELERVELPVQISARSSTRTVVPLHPRKER